MFTGLTAGTAVAYAESGDDNYDFDNRLDRYCISYCCSSSKSCKHYH